MPVTREEVVIERHPASGRPAAGSIKEGEEIRVPLTEEEVRVEKRPVVKEEISVGKRKVQETETVRDTVRREEARIEEMGAARVRDPWKGKERASPARSELCRSRAPHGDHLIQGRPARE